MYTLGLNAYHADSSAAIFQDGQLIAATEEERFRRIKHWAGFPDLAVKFCLKEAGISLDQVDHIAIGRDPLAKLHRKIFYLLSNPNGLFRAATQRAKNAIHVSSLEEEFIKIDPGVDPKAIKKKIHQIEHHRSHLASAFFASPFRESALLSIDGSGDFSTTMTGKGSGNSFEVLGSLDFPHSAGLFYSCLTQFLGFPHYGDEYKVMGLAPYGTPLYVDKLKDILQFTDNGFFKLNLKYFNIARQNIISYGDDHIPVVAELFSEQLVSVFGPARRSGDELTQFHKDLAASVQRLTEELIYHLLSALHNRTGLDQVCIAGGVAQNSVANGKLTRNTKFKKIFIPSAGHDAGIAMGAALYHYHQVLNKERTAFLPTAFTGSQFSNEEIESFLHNKGIQCRKYSDKELFDIVADQIIDSGVVGWFNGRAEFGPRALGGRSIIADPRRIDAKDLLNHKVKRRESFRPFAPSILKEYVSEYFEVTDDVPFMEKVFPIRPEKRGLIPAVTHVDGTGRLQTVDKEVSPRYYGLIENFRQKTGIPILLNTSFNENEPIVNTPEEALDCFLRTKMDMLVLQNCVITRQP